MTKNIQHELEEMSFKQKNECIKLWNLYNKESNLNDIHVWIEYDDREKLNCLYDFEIRTELQNTLTFNNSTINENIKNKVAFEDFIKINLNNVKFKDKFVAFVNGEFQDVGDKKNALIKKMYKKFGNVDMYVHKVTDKKNIILIDTTEFT